MVGDKLYKRILITTVLSSFFLLGCRSSQIDIIPAGSPTLQPRDVPDKPEHTALDLDTFTGIIIVKFIEGADIRLRNGKLVSVSTGAIAELDQIFARFPLEKIERLFTQPEDEIAKEQAEMEANTGEDLPDLNLYYRLKIQDKSDGEALIDALNDLTIVELAYPEATPAPPPQQP